MLYAIGSKFFKAVVAMAAVAHACGNCCADEVEHAHSGETMAHSGSGQKQVHDLADMGGEFDMGDMKLDDMDMDMPAGDAPPAMVTDEQYEEARAALDINDEDMAKIVGFVGKVPAEWKDHSDEDTAKMFVHHFKNDKGTENKTKEDLLKELQQLVEEEIPMIQQQMAAEQANAGMDMDMPAMPTDMELDDLDNEKADEAAAEDASKNEEL